VIETEFIGGEPVMILFGSTLQSIKECFEVFIPGTDGSLTRPVKSDTKVINEIFLRILQTEGLKPDSLLPQTNVFILFGRLAPVENNPELIWVKSFKLSKSCKKRVIHFRGPSDFEILEDSFINMSLSEKVSETTTEAEPQQYYWMQSKTYVKGFKDILVNNKSIWNN
jgi:hypothetical protein